MRLSKPLIIIGITIVVLGLIFHLQGQSIVGPPTSFMYANPDWTDYGIRIVVIGSIIIGIGVVVRITRKC